MNQAPGRVDRRNQRDGQQSQRHAGQRNLLAEREAEALRPANHGL